MGQALYRKYRSKSLSEIVGQEHVTTTLKNALEQGRISHAYLLTGPKGVGKTSIARILAHEINQLPYDDEAHLDIIEIDAASNRRIDEMRDLRDRVNTAPAKAKYKVYIIDEVHMLTKEAFNALLKTLEEPPAHVVFILATTEAHKLPETIISRTQRYSFRPVPNDQVVAHLKYIAKKEKIIIDDDALILIAAHGEGSFRDSISLLDQAASTTEHITRTDIEHILGLAPSERIADLQSALERGASEVTAALSSLYDQGYEPAMVASQLGALVRESVITNNSANPHADLDLLKKLLDVPAARNPKLLLEIILLQTGTANFAPLHPVANTVRTAPPRILANKVQSQPVSEPKPMPATEGRSSEPEAENRAAEIASPGPMNSSKEVSELWQNALNDIKRQYNTLYGIARMATPDLTGDKLTLTFKFAFHQKRLNEAKNRKILADAMERLSGRSIEIVCVVGEITASNNQQPDVSAISNIFGGAELLES